MPTPFDLVLANHHDEGHAPVEVLDLEAGVNITISVVPRRRRERPP